MSYKLELSSRKSLFQKPQSALEKFKSAPNPQSAVSQNLLKQVAKQPQRGIKPKRLAISRNDYPSIVKLKLAGHTDKSIAKKLGVKSEQLKAHVTRALTDYRNGELLIEAGETVAESRRKGASKTDGVLNQASTLESGYGSYRSEISIDSTLVGVI